MAQRDLSNRRQFLEAPAPDISREQLVSGFAELGKQIIKTSQEAKILENHSRAQMDIAKLNNDFQIKYQGDPFNEQGLKEFQFQRDKILKQYGDEISPIFRGQWEGEARKLSAANDGQIQAWGFKQAQVNAGESMKAAAENYLNEAGFLGRDVAAGKKTQLDMASSLNSALEQLTKFGMANLGETVTMSAIRDFKSKYASNAIEGVIDVNPFQAKEMIDSKEFEELLGFDNHLALTNKIDAEIKRRKTEAIMSQYTQQLLTNARLADPSSKADRISINKAYEASGIAELFSNGDPDAIQETIGIINRTSIIPESVQSTLRGFMFNGNAEQKQRAYSIIDAISVSNPAALTGSAGFTEAEIKDAGAFNSLIRAGASPDFANTVIQNSKNPLQQDIIKLRDSESEKNIKNVNIESSITDAFDEGILSLEPSFAGSENLARATVDFKKLYRENYILYGNHDSAVGSALAAIKINYGITASNGKKEVMQFPPEQYYGLPNLSYEENGKWIYKQLQEGLKTAAPEIDASEVSLVPSMRSGAMVSQGLKPTYHIMVSKEVDGFPRTDYLRGNNNMPIEIKFNPEPVKDKLIREQQKKIDIAIAQREARQTITARQEELRYGSLANISATLSDPTPLLGDWLEKQISDYQIQSGIEKKYQETDEYNQELDKFKKALDERR